MEHPLPYPARLSLVQGLAWSSCLRQLGEWMDGWMDGQVDGWTDGRMHGDISREHTVRARIKDPRGFSGFSIRCKCESGGR